MIRNISKFVSVAVVVAFVTHASVANAYYTLTTGTTAGGAYLIWKFMSKETTSTPESKAKADKEAEGYVRQNAAQLNNDLALASGPIINDMAASLKIAPANKAQFRKVIRENRSELMDLASVETLTPERAGEFFRVLATKIESDPVLAADLANAQNS